MTMIDIQVTLPESLAREAKARGLLNNQAIQTMITHELERQHSIERLFATMDRLAEDRKDDLTEADVVAEISSYRAEKRAARASRG